MYPEVCALLPDLKDGLLEVLLRHHVSDVRGMELIRIRLPGPAERFYANATVLLDERQQPISKGRAGLVPKVRAGLSRTTILQ